MQQIFEARLAMAAKGYVPIPVIGKIPPLSGWQKTREVSQATLEEWGRIYPGATNTGIVTRNAPVLDLDLLNDAAVTAAVGMVRQRFGDRGRILIRVGRAPRCAIPFRTSHPFKKLLTTFVAPASVEPDKIEFLCDGQQLVADGIHPDTLGAYVWADGDPTTVAHADLPEIGGEVAAALVADIVAMLVADFGYVTECKPTRRKAVKRVAPAPANTARDMLWAASALEKECALVADTKEGDRNNVLNKAAFSLWQIIAGNPDLLDEQEVRDRLFEAAEACGLVEDGGADKVWKTIDSGAKGGAQNPRKRPPAEAEQPASLRGFALGLEDADAGFGPTAASGASAAVAADEYDERGRLLVDAREGDKSAMLDRVEGQLVRCPAIGLYQRGGQLVRAIVIRTAAADNRSTLTWRLAEADPAHLFDAFTRIVAFQKYDGRRKKPVPADCPWQLPTMYRSRHRWKVPTLLGIVHTPQLRADGSLVEASGYDPDTRLLFLFDGEAFPPILERPTWADAHAALKVIEDAIATFPFKTDVDRAVALSLFLTVLAWRNFDLAPVHAVTAPTSGTGKSLLVSLASILASGQTAPVIAMGKDKNEFRKLFASQLLAGVPIIAIDNIEQTLTSDLLCQAVSEEQKEIRLFGHLQTAVIRAGSLITATGNNLAIGKDMSRRVLTSELDAGMERPERRRFKVRIKTVFRQRRGELVTALLTVLRAARLARGEIEALKLEPLGGFEEWCAWVRDPLVWLGRADPVASVETSYASNVDREGLQDVLQAWESEIGIGQANMMPPMGIVAKVNPAGALGVSPCPNLLAALLLVAEDRRATGRLSAKRLGWWLKDVRNKPVGNLTGQGRAAEKAGVLDAGRELAGDAPEEQAMSNFLDDLSDLERWRSEQPLDYPEAMIKLIDALRDYIRTNVTLADELLREESITREQYDKGMVETEQLAMILCKLEGHGIDPTLNGIIGEEEQ